MNPPAIRDLAGIDEPGLERLGASLAGVRTLDDLIDWGRGRVPPATVAEIVTQDEYSHDVLVPVEPSRWLAFDVT